MYIKSEENWDYAMFFLLAMYRMIKVNVHNLPLKCYFGTLPSYYASPCTFNSAQVVKY